MIFQADDALDDSTCERLCSIYDRHSRLARINDYSGFPVLHWWDFENAPEIYDMLRVLMSRTRDRVVKFLPDFAPVYPETLFLAYLGTGGCHPKHADNSEEDEDGHWGPNHTPHRDVSALYYLNDDFEGGEIVFEQHGLAIKPHRGLLVVFPSDRHHVHEVLPVTAGKRYSVQMWFTKQETCALGGVSA
jgi:predicted 2-oxoglutarate/Fe(II)-dependent dioxygenase YbiX